MLQVYLLRFGITGPDPGTRPSPTEPQVRYDWSRSVPTGRLETSLAAPDKHNKFNKREPLLKSESESDNNAVWTCSEGTFK